MQEKKLTQKQQELVKKLEKIRNSRENTKQQVNKTQKQQTTTDSQRRNENLQQRRLSSKRSDQARSQPVKQSKFARPTEDRPSAVKPKVEYKPKAARSQRKTQRPPAKPKNKKYEEHYIKRLNTGKKLSQALILSEILDKPVALRRK